MAAAKPDEGAPASVVESGSRLLIIVLGIMSASLMQTLDGTITNVALPNIQGNLGVSQDAATWVVTGYTVAALIIIPITPWLQNRFGRKNYYVASIVGFTAASVMCGLSDQLPALVTWRVIQGAFGGGLLAVGQSILRDSFPPEKLGASQGIFAIGVVLGPALGPPLGGLIVDNASWNLVFFINIVPGLISTAIMLAFLRDPRKPQKAKLDFVGLGLLIVFVGSLQYVLTEGEQDYWLADPIIAALTFVSLVSFGAFIFWELRGTDKPVVDLRVLSNRSVSAGSLLAFALGAVLYGSSYALPQYTQGPLGFTPTLSGELFIIRAVPIGLATPLIVRLVAKFDARILVGLGFLLIGIGSVAQAQETTLVSDFWTFGVALVCMGAGTAFSFTPLTIAVLGGTKPDKSAAASAFINLGIQLGGSIAVALLAVVLDRQQSVHADRLRSQATLANGNVQQYLHLQHGSLVQLSNLVNTQALIEAYADATVVVGLLAFVCIPLIFLMKKPAKSSGAAGAGGG